MSFCADNIIVMNRTRLKLRARQALAENTAQARIITIIYLIFRLCAYALSAFFVYCILLLPEYLESEPYGVPSAFYFTLFILCLGIVFGFSATLNYLLHRRFCFSDKAGGFFKILPVRFQLKIIYLHFLKISRNLAIALFYLFPFTATLLYIAVKLNSGIDRKLFAPLLVLSLIYLILGLFFLLASRQKTAFLDADFTSSPNTDVRRCFENACKLDRKSCLRLAKLKLSFMLWYLICPAIVPIVFVMPYYLATLAEYKKTEPEEQALQ